MTGSDPGQCERRSDIASHVAAGDSQSGIRMWPRLLLGVASLIVAAVVWLPLVHLFFRADPAEYRSSDAIPPRASRLAQRHILNWQVQERRAADAAVLQACNPEWDLMSRCFTVLSLVNMSLREPAKQDMFLGCIDRMIDDTLAAEHENGQSHFLLPYARARSFVVSPPRSLHVDSQVGLMLAARCMLQKHERYMRILQNRIEIMQQRMQASPVLAAESYPDECWMFDIVNGLVVMRMHDVLTGTDHAAFREHWLDVARDHLVHDETGLLISSFSVSGKPKDGPEGSTIWMVAHGLQLIDVDFARDQCQRARKELSRTLLGFGYASEWPRSWGGSSDVDSGPQIPILEISAGSSGLALLGASAFDDTRYLSELMTTLDFAAFPQEGPDGLRYCASNEVGDAVLLYAEVLGPLWDRVKSGGDS